MALKSFNSDGYKCVKVMIFNELAIKMAKVKAGSVICLMTPKPMKPTADQGYSFVIELDA